MMIHLHGSIPARTTLAVLVILAAFTACKKKDVPYVVDADELSRYIKESPDAMDLFRTDNLITTHPYKVPFDSAVYVDSALGLQRAIVSSTSPYGLDYGYLGSLREAVVHVQDVFTVRRVRKLGGVIVDSVIQDRTLDRYGFFLKLGNDAQSFVGWKLWGYNGLGEYDPPPVMTVKLPGGQVIEGGLGLYAVSPKYGFPVSFGGVEYVRLDQIDTVARGAQLVLEATPKSGNPLAFYHTYCMATDSGLQTRNMTRLGTNHFLDTVKTSSTPGRTYNLIYMQSYLESDRRWVWSWCVPYQVR